MGIYDHIMVLYSGSMKGNMMDILVVGKDDVLVKAAYFILAYFSLVLEEVFSRGRSVHITTNLTLGLSYSWLWILAARKCC